MNKLKNILYSASILLFFAFTFQSIPPGWFQQIRPVNDVINDIFFLDSLNGWAVTNGSFNTNDTAYIFKTTNGGDNWLINFSSVEKLNVIQFVNENTGYVGGGSNGGAMLTFLKTTNTGLNWQRLTVPDGVYISDIFFYNSDTGWICDGDGLFGGLYKTTNGGMSWQLQIGSSARPQRMFFLSNDTGWFVNSASSGSLYRTTNSGINWNLQYNFSTQINDVYFLNALTGIVSSIEMYRTTNGGFNWIQTTTSVGGIKISFATDSIGWAGSNFQRITKTTNMGQSWFYQSTPISNPSVSAYDSLKVWAGGAGIIHTTDGGSLSALEQIGNEMPIEYELFQNYPNPFNPSTKIRFSVKRQTSNVKLLIYNSIGEFISELFNGNLLAGTYEVQFTANNLSSGIYYYTLITDNFKETKKMLLLK
ncbi:MAG TPA: T9SS type A sorting domain-containing protein [Ignavibacteria bacterium]|nr:T9SS type A sorting domain-containing protein [Ignavibacteria bacterium]